jgi:hypothetical protein
MWYILNEILNKPHSTEDIFDISQIINEIEKDEGSNASNGISPDNSSKFTENNKPD